MMKSTVKLRSLQAQDLTHENFAPYGQVAWAQSDGKPFDTEDVELHLDQGIPRFYIMRLENRGLRFQKITHHQNCTQCLGSLGGIDWLMAVSPPNALPTLESLKAFRVPGDCFIKLNQGTWHAGPYFIHEAVSFYNLELSDTNIVDHHNYDFAAQLGYEFEIVAPFKLS